MDRQAHDRRGDCGACRLPLAEARLQAVQSNQSSNARSALVAVTGGRAFLQRGTAHTAAGGPSPRTKHLLFDLTTLQMSAFEHPAGCASCSFAGGLNCIIIESEGASTQSAWRDLSFDAASDKWSPAIAS
jgi:hypothetical protein